MTSSGVEGITVNTMETVNISRTRSRKVYHTLAKRK